MKTKTLLTIAAAAAIVLFSVNESFAVRKAASDDNLESKQLQGTVDQNNNVKAKTEHTGICKRA